MVGTGALTGAGQIAERTIFVNPSAMKSVPYFVYSHSVFPWDELPNGTRLCDIGGGKGHVMLGILKKHSHLRATIQDLPGAVKDAEQVSFIHHVSSSNFQSAKVLAN